jgi:hypothetical protein
MDPLELRQTIYLGDRGVEGILVQDSGRTVKVQIDSISRQRNPDGLWRYYTDEDIDNGYLVFGDVEAFTIDPPGSTPNDYIGSFEITGSDESPGKYLAVIETAGPTPAGGIFAITIRILCGTFYLEDPKKPGIQITT